MPEATKTLVQCDFDGTITEEDVSFILLDTFATGDWRQLHRQYEAAEIPVGRFNREAFAMIKADQESLLKIARAKTRIRPGFHQLIAYCRQKGFRFVIVSNGLDFYIAEILRSLGLSDIEFFAAQTRFHHDGLRVQYIGPAGNYLEENFKESYVNLFLNQGYRIIYLGNGASDVSPASQCRYVFATGAMPLYCQQAKLNCTPFTDFNQVVSVLESW